ncbi:MAG: hypothetical protein KDA80_23850 [Planctomycetaceae bacterium]|nr:hypothetical protein [Planctomycetaceae bacterium]
MLAMISFVARYLRFYRDEFIDFWEHMTPSEYGLVLIGVFVFGFLLMKSRR